MKSAAEAHRMLSNTYGEAAISERMCREWFQLFKNGDFDIQDHALYLVEPARRSVLWTVKTDWNTHRRSVSNAIDAFEPSIERQTAAIQRETRVVKWFCSMTMLDPMLKVVKTYLETWNEKSYPTRRILQTLLPLIITCFDQWHTAWLTSSFRSYEEVKNWIDSWIASKDDQFFRHGIRTLPERWEKVVASDGQYFES